MYSRHWEHLKNKEIGKRQQAKTEVLLLSFYRLEAPGIKYYVLTREICFLYNRDRNMVEGILI